MADQEYPPSKDNSISKDPDRPRPRFSPFSPFPYGSPLTKMNSLQTSFSGSPGQKMLLGTSLVGSQSAYVNGEREVMTPRLKGQDLYGGPVMFGSSARKSRLMSASPYTAAFRSRAAEKQNRLERVTFPPSLGAVAPPPSSLPSTAPSSPHSSPGPSSSPPAPLSSTARVILSTLEKLSAGGTPVTDAKKIPLASPSSASRVEKRKLLESELNCSLSSSPGRRRPRLGGGGLALALAGPPLRKNFSPSLNTSTSSASNSSISTPQSSRSMPSSKVAEPMKKVPDESIRTNKSDCINATSNQAKSSLKMKSKVTDSGRSRPDLSSVPPPPPISSIPKTNPMPTLQVDKMPVFNFTSTPAPVKPIPNTPSSLRSEVKPIPNTPSSLRSEVKPIPSTPSSLRSEVEEEKKTVSPPSSPIPPEVLERNNNNKSPLKRQINEMESTGDSDSSKKLKSVPTPPPPSLAQPKVNESKVGPNKFSSTKTFSFSAPKSVIEQSEPKTEPVNEASKRYKFSLPGSVQSSENKTISVANGPPGGSVNSVPSASVPSFNFKSSNDSSIGKSELNFTSKKTMPDITNNILSKSLRTDKLKGSNSMTMMPDVTATTGFGGFLPAKELKTGSVMDILGKKV